MVREPHGNVGEHTQLRALQRLCEGYDELGHGARMRPVLGAHVIDLPVEQLRPPVAERTLAIEQQKLVHRQAVLAARVEIVLGGHGRILSHARCIASAGHTVASCSKLARAAGSLSVTSIRSTLAAGGPTFASSMNRSTLSASPSTTASTDPSPRLRTQPSRPRLRAVRTAQLR